MSTDIRERLAGLSIEIGPETAAVHQGVITSELRSPSPVPPRRLKRRRLPVVVTAALVVVALSAAGAVGAETALPGDRLYPVKQATEWVRSWVDPTVPADHRIDELEVLLDHRAAQEAISDQLRLAEDAVERASVGDAVVDAPLVDRLDRVRDLVPPPGERLDEAAFSDHPSIDSPPIGDEMHEQVRPGDEGGNAEQEGSPDVAGDQRKAELESWCKRVAVAAERGDDVPRWMLRRCHSLLSENSP